MSWFTSLFSSGAASLVDSFGKAIDSITTSDEERLALRNELQEAMNAMAVEMENKVQIHEKEITKRWESDNRDGSWLSKNIRPLTLVYLMCILTIMAFFDGNAGGFKIAEAYIPLFQSLAITAFGGYFVARTFEKHSSNKNNIKV